MLTRRTVALTALAVVCILLATLVTGRWRPQVQRPLDPPHPNPEMHIILDRDRASVPFIFVYMYPKYPGLDEDVIGGLKVAVWQDGRVVRARSAAEIGKAYIKGRLEPERVDELVRSIERSGILETPEGGNIPHHVAYDTLKLRTRGKLWDWSHAPPAKDGALVKKIEEMLMAIEAPITEIGKWEGHYPSEWDE